MIAGIAVLVSKGTVLSSTGVVTSTGGVEDTSNVFRYCNSFSVGIDKFFVGGKASIELHPIKSIVKIPHNIVCMRVSIVFTSAVKCTKIMFLHNLDYR